MDVFDCIRTVLSVRQYQDKAVPEDVVREIVEAGQLTASSMNLQPWHFIVVENRDTLRKIGGLAKTGPYIAQATLAIVVAIEEDSRYGVSDGSRAIQSMILAAWEHGVGSNWVGFMGPNEVKPLLGIPDNLTILAIVPFGYPAQSIGKGIKKRKPLAEVASRERYGTPYQ